MKKLGLMLVGLSIASLSHASAIGGKPESIFVKEVRQTANLMPVMPPGGRPVRSQITFEARSGGCTRAEDFRVDVLVVGGAQYLTLVRTRPDLCEAVVHRKTLEIETEKLALSSKLPLVISNPVYADELVVY